MFGAFVFIAMLASSDGSPAASAPLPAATPLREIVRVKAVGGVCRTLETLVLPVAQIVGRNDGDFVALEKPLNRFQNGKGFGTAGDAESFGSTALASKGEALSGDSGDNQDTYTPERTMAASNIDRLFGIIMSNLDSADSVMKRSWEAHPKNGDPAIDALRQRVQNVIDLQRVLAFRIDDVAGTYFSNSGVASLTPKADRGAFNALLARAMDTQIAGDESDPQNLVLSKLPIGDVAAQKHGSAGDVARALRVQKLALSIESIRIAKACDASASTTVAPNASASPNAGASPTASAAPNASAAP